MIVVLSDLHLQHIALDGVRRRDGDRILATEVSRNVLPSSLETLAGEIETSVEATKVFAGDVFELHRTPWWMLGGRTLRPTHSAAVNELRRATLEILELIAADCRGFFEAVGRIVEQGSVPRAGDRRILAGQGRLRASDARGWSYVITYEVRAVE